MPGGKDTCGAKLDYCFNCHTKNRVPPTFAYAELSGDVTAAYYVVVKRLARGRNTLLLYDLNKS